MSHPVDLDQPSDPLDELVDKLLESGGVFSQLIGHMLEFERSQGSFPELAPIPEVAQSVVRSLIGDLERRYSRRDIRIAARLVDEVTNALCEEIFLYSSGGGRNRC
jgi:signal transduction histidine kinase